VLSRQADSCFWIGRYVERAECTARMVDVHYHYRLERAFVPEETLWRSILAISGQEDAFYKRNGVGNEDESAILQFFCFDESNPSSIVSSIGTARENARAIRQQISSEMWESLNRAYLELRRNNVNKILHASPHAFFQIVKDYVHLFQGIVDRTLMKGQPRDFLDAGRYLERAAQTARIIDVKYHVLLPRFAQQLPPEEPSLLPEPDSVGGPVDVHGWIAVLKSVGGLEAFRKTRPASVNPTEVSEFVLLHEDFPASVRFCVDQLYDAVERLTEDAGMKRNNPARQTVFRLKSTLESVTGAEVVAIGMHEFLQSVLSECDKIGGAITETFLRR